MSSTPTPLSPHDVALVAGIRAKYARRNVRSAIIAGLTLGMVNPRVWRVSVDNMVGAGLAIRVELKPPTAQDWTPARKLAYVAGGVVYVVAVVIATAYGAAWLAGVQ